jgi:hypothetical protein
MDLRQRFCRWTARLGAHLLGSIGVALALGAMVPWFDPNAADWLPWAADGVDRISSLCCGVALMAGGGGILKRADDDASDDGDA